jgi:hypothetical protein
MNNIFTTRKHFERFSSFVHYKSWISVKNFLSKNFDWILSLPNYVFHTFEVQRFLMQILGIVLRTNQICFSKHLLEYKVILTSMHWLAHL